MDKDKFHKCNNPKYIYFAVSNHFVNSDVVFEDRIGTDANFSAFSQITCGNTASSLLNIKPG